MRDTLFRTARTHLCIIPIIIQADNITDVILTSVYRRPIIRRYLNVLMLKNRHAACQEIPGTDMPQWNPGRYYQTGIL